MDERALLLIVEDDAPLRDRLARAFAQRGFDVRAAATIEQAEQIVATDAPEYVVLDLRVGDRNGLDLLPTLIRADPATRVVVLTGYGSIATALDAVHRGATHYLTKPADVDEILAAFERAGAPSTPPLPPLQPMSLDRVEWEHINRVLVECGGNVSEAARQLGLHRRSLQRKLAKFPSSR
jgi:two-component system response regulator RegA